MYRVLYRKWRPQVFSDVIGQSQVTATLQSQLKENRLAHAYLFTGSRGTGKTTCAKILAKAVSCLNPVDGNPCNECEICRGIDSGTVLDTVEIDAASNRGIDDIRVLRDEVNFLPSKAKYRVYIIDEVHMLTIEAFNALLKTLEEPPEHVIFILATTEVHKLPSTILSRCQRFDFRRIEPKMIADRLMYIAGEEGAVLHEDAAMLIARLADGGMRDALSLLDRAISVENEVTTDVVSASAGLMGRDYIYSLIRALANKDTSKCLLILDDLHNASCDTERLCTELSNQFRNFLIMKTVEHPENLIVCTPEELNELKALSDSFTTEQVLYALNTFTKATDAIKRTQNRRIEAEMAIIKLCAPETDTDVSALLARISALEKEIGELKRNGIRVAAPQRTATPIRQAAPVTANTADSTPEYNGADDDEIPENAITGGSDSTEKVQNASDLPFGPDSGNASDLPFGPDSGNTSQHTPAASGEFRGFGSEPEITSYTEKFAVLDEPVINDSFMSQYGKQYPDSGKASSDEVGTAPPSDLDGLIDASTWLKVILRTEQTHNPAIGQLTNSYAYTKGDTLYIHPRDPQIKIFLRVERLSEYVSAIAEQILGKKYIIRYDEDKK